MYKVNVLRTAFCHSALHLHQKSVFSLQTNEVNQGDALEHNFSAVYSALLLPVSHIFPVQEFPQVTMNHSHRMGCVGRDLKYHLVPTSSAIGKDTSYYTKASSNLALTISRLGSFITSLDKLFQCLTTFIWKKFLLMSHLNQASSSLKLSLLVLSLHL